MKKRVAYYVSRKNPLIWLAALVMLASAALRIANVCGKGADAKTVWFLVVLPVVVCVFYVLNILCNGSDRFYRSSVPVILLAIYYGIKITLVSPYLWLTFMFWIAYLAIAAFYAVTVSGHIKSTIPLLLLLIAALGILAGMHEKEFTQENWPQLRQILPDMLFLLAGILTLLGAKVYLDGAYHPTWGDRPDGRRLRTLDPMAVVANYIMPTRIGSSNFIRESVDNGINFHEVVVEASLRETTGQRHLTAFKAVLLASAASLLTLVTVTGGFADTGTGAATHTLPCTC